MTSVAPGIDLELTSSDLEMHNFLVAEAAASKNARTDSWNDSHFCFPSAYSASRFVL
jgi:hypothetical protein